MSDLWLIEYERALDELESDREKFGDDDAKKFLRSTLRALGFDQHEIDNEIEGIDQ